MELSEPMRLWKAIEVAAFLRVSKRHIEYLIEEGKIRTVKIGKKLKRIPNDELERLLIEGTESK